MREKGHQRWSWAGCRVMVLSHCSAHGHCCRGWWRLSHHSGCSDPCCSGAPGWYTVTGDRNGGNGDKGATKTSLVNTGEPEDDRLGQINFT